MALFNKEKIKSEVKMDTAPDGIESKKEIQYMENLESNKQKEHFNYKEIPVCLSQAQINNLIIENNIMLKQIISELD